MDTFFMFAFFTILLLELLNLKCYSITQSLYKSIIKVNHPNYYQKQKNYSIYNIPSNI
jgi:hypothetical protein